MPTTPQLPTLEPLRLDDDFQLDVNYFLRAEYTDIGQASAELPPIIEWVNSRLQGLVEAKLIKKQEIKEVEAEVYFELNDGLFVETYSSDVKQTAAAFDRAIARDPRVKAIHREFAVLAGWVQRLTNLQFSLQSKLDLVRSTEATRRRILEDNSSE
jgi:hypothetical protein